MCRSRTGPKGGAGIPPPHPVLLDIPWIITSLEKILGPAQNHAQHFKSSQIKATFRTPLNSFIYISLEVGKTRLHI